MYVSILMSTPLIMMVLSCCFRVQCTTLRETTSTTQTTSSSSLGNTQTPEVPYLTALHPDDAILLDPECRIERCGPCHCCYKSTETRANCFGPITDVPRNLPLNITHLTIAKTDIVQITAMEIVGSMVSQFSIYTQLKRLEFKDNKKLANIDVGAFNFDPLFVEKNSLKRLSIDGSPLLKEITDGAFGYFGVLSDISIRYCGLTKPPLWKKDAFENTVYIMDLSHNEISEIPDKTFEMTQHIKIGTIDLSYNRITTLKPGLFKGAQEIGTVKFNHNQLDRAHGYAFGGSKIKKLLLSDNERLKTLDKHTFSDTHLEFLDLSRTAISELPTDGLQTLTNLTIEGTPSLLTFPSVLEMRYMKEARLTYAHHCCAFHHPEKQNRTAYDIFEREIQLECTTSTIKPTTIVTRTEPYGDIHDRIPRGTRHVIHERKFNKRNFRRRKRGDKTSRTLTNVFPDISRLFNISNASQPSINTLGGFYNIHDGSDSVPAWDTFHNGFNEENFHASTLDPASTYVSNMTCGELVEHIRKVQCMPVPDAFNPCEDILGFAWLRVIAWFVVVTAEVGNLAVIIVTLCTKYKLTGLNVSKFLICNLALADLTLGMYLLFLAAYDMSSKGQYFTYAIPWQYHGGCQVAGFLATFSTCLSTFTLTAITYERWYTIRYAMNPDKQVTLHQAAVIMFCGWAFSLIMAMLPLLGVSNFSKTSICLPMDATSPVAKGYVIVLMLANAGCFVVICIFYTDIYCKIRINKTTSAIGQSDANIAKRMASLVITDFMCLFPIVFFGLTAVMGYPLIDVTESKILLVIFFPLNACANPFLYVIATKHFRQDFVGILSRCGFCERKASEYRLAMGRNPFRLHSKNSHSGVTSAHTTKSSAGTSQNMIQHGVVPKTDTNGLRTGVRYSNSRKLSLEIIPWKIDEISIPGSPVLNGYHRASVLSEPTLVNSSATKDHHMITEVDNV